MQATDILFNGVSIVGVISAVFTLLIICVPKLRSKFVEYILLKHDKELTNNKIGELETIIGVQNEQIEELKTQIYTLTTTVNDLKIQLTKYETLYGHIE